MHVITERTKADQEKLTHATDRQEIKQVVAVGEERGDQWSPSSSYGMGQFLLAMGLLPVLAAIVLTLFALLPQALSLVLTR